MATGRKRKNNGVNSSAWRQWGNEASAAARTGATRQQRRWGEQQQGPGRGQRGVDNDGKSRGNAATPVVRTMARETRRDQGEAATTAGYRGDGGGGVDSDGGGKSDGRATMTTGYGGDGGGLRREFGASLVRTKGYEKSEYIAAMLGAALEN